MSATGSDRLRETNAIRYLQRPIISGLPRTAICYQPDTMLSCWFHERVARNGGRLKKPMIVAMARKLLVALWKYATAGVVIEGAIIKTA